MKVTFTKYVKLVLPLDGYVFWVRADLLSPSALFNSSAMNSAALGKAPVVVTPAATLVTDGSLHYATSLQQEEAEVSSTNRVLFTSKVLIEDFNQAGPFVLFIATYEGIDFAFGGRDWFYTQADIHHYYGNAVYNDMKPQLINALDGFDTRTAVASNSLPLWLGINGYAPIYPSPWAPVAFQLYPSFLSPLNLNPPYGIVHIEPSGTRAIQAFPTIARDGSHSQLVADRVRVTLWGTRNTDALDFIDSVNDYSLNTDHFGIMNMPVVRDEKRTQAELQAIAMKKTIEFDVSYYQTRANTVARQLITSAFTTLTVGQIMPPISDGQLTDDFGNPLTDDQGNPLTDDGITPPPPPAFHQLTDDAGNPLTDDAGNPLTDDAG